MHAVVNNIPAVSVISKIEVLGFNSPTEELNLLKSFFNDVVVLDMSEEVVEQTIVLRSTVRIKIPDAIIAATALVYNLTLITRNVADFKYVPGLLVINPYSYS